MLKIWRWYQKCLTLHPLKTQVISSSFIWGFGDVAAQTITSFSTPSSHQLCHQFQDDEEELKFNWKRVATTSAFGFVFVGPVGHFWYEGLDRFTKSRLGFRPNSLPFVAAKIAIDAFLFGPLDLLAFLTFMGVATGKSARQIQEDVKRDFLPAFVLEGGVWPFLQVVNFRFVPVRYQLQYANVFGLLDSSVLSWIEQQEDAPWKQRFKSYLPLKNKEKEQSK